MTRMMTLEREYKIVYTITLSHVHEYRLTAEDEEDAENKFLELIDEWEELHYLQGATYVEFDVDQIALVETNQER